MTLIHTATWWKLLLTVVALVLSCENLWASQKICLTMVFEASNLQGVKADRNQYKKIADANDCRHIEISKDFFLKNTPKAKALKLLKEQLGEFDEVLLMYSGHGVCIGESPTPSTSQGQTRGYQYRLAGVVVPPKNGIVSESKGPKMFGMIFGDYDFCISRCEGKDYEACERSCGLKHSVHDGDLASLFADKKMTTIIDACGSGCQNADFLKTKQLNSITSASWAESTIDTPEGGILNLRLSEAAKTSEACHMDVNSDGKISFAEMSRYMGSTTNQSFPSSYEGDEFFKNTRAISPREKGGGSSSFDLGSYNRAELCSGTSGGQGKGRGVR